MLNTGNVFILIKKVLFIKLTCLFLSDFINNIINI